MGTIIRTQLPIRILLCGLGVWGRNWLENIRKNKNYDLAGVVESDQATLDQVRMTGLIDNSKCFSDIVQAIKLTRPDAVAVIVAPDRHGDIVRIALENNIHILSEKPLARDIDEAREFIQLHKLYPNVRFIINQNYRGRDCITLIKNIIDEGGIGEIGYFIYNHQQTVKIPGYRLEMPSPVLDDMSIHHFDLMRYLTNQDFEKIYAVENVVPWSWFQGKPMFNSLINMTGGVTGVYCACWAAEGKIGDWNGNIQIYGSRGCLELTDDSKVILHEKHGVNEDLLGTYQSGHEITQVAIENLELQYTLENFKNALMEGAPCETDIEDNIKSFMAVLMAKESIKQKCPVLITSLNIPFLSD
ncbi:MAG: Gfo/Idh/MocA family oxidoreductase [Spirochaetales bacterium]|nr:Gfo/Idh/MocA family oxidoreductase [Spirochaetales bacterium]